MPSRDPASWLWVEACELLDRAERLHRQFFRLGRPHERPTWEPPVDIYETEQDLTILVALPGVDPQHVELAATDDAIIVAGERPIPVELRSSRRPAIRRLEIPYGRFERRIELPARRFELTQRDLINGCLTITLKKIT